MALAPDDYTPSTRERLSTFFRLSRPDDDSPTPTSVQSSAQIVELGNESAMQAVLRSRQQWQTQVWDAYDVCGEIHNAVNAVADLMSRIVIYAADIPDAPNETPSRTTNETAIKVLSRLGTFDEQSTLLHDMSQQKLLPADFNLVSISPGPGRPSPREEWLVLSIDEVKVEGSTAAIEHPSGITIKLQKGNDSWTRIWTPHPRKRRLADSPLRPLLSNIDELVWWDMAGAAVAKNRLASTGMIGFPDNLVTPVEEGDDPRLSGTERFIKKWFRNVGRAIREPGSSSAAVPLAFTYPANEKGDPGVKHISIDRPQDELMEKRTDRSLRRIAQGFPLPVEAFFGLGEATHWGAGQIEKSKFTEIVEPFVIEIIGDLTRHWFRPILRKLGVNPDKFLLWYDASNLIVQPNLEEQSNKGFEYGTINEKTWRRVNTFSESDAPTEEEKAAQLAWIRALRGREGNPAVQQDGNPPPENQTDMPRQTQPGQSHPDRVKPAASSRGKGQPVFASASPRDLGTRLAEIDSDLMSRLQVMASEQMRVALVKAGNFLSNRARKNPTLRASIRNVRSEDVAATLGRENVLALGTDGMLDETFADVPQLFSSWCDKAVDAAIEAAQLPPTIVASGSFQLAYSTTDAATQLVRDLRELAATLVFDRTPSDSAPEADDMLVPASIIRRALAAVGNPSPNGHRNLLLATGRSFTSHLAEAGHFVTSHRWVYPAKPRHPFAHHQSLDGQTFKVDDSPNQPGEVENCICVAAPMFTNE